MFKIVIVDDIDDVLNCYKHVIQNIIISENMKAEISLCANNPHTIIQFLEHNSASLFLLDVDLKSYISGLELAYKIRQKLKNVYIIFVSGHGEFVFDSFEVRPFDFLVKPVPDSRLKHAVLSAYNDFMGLKIELVNEQYLDVKYCSTIHRVKIKDLIYIEKNGKHVIFHSKESAFSCNLTLCDVQQLLIDKGLQDIIIQVHKTYFVNVQFVQTINSKNNVIILESGVEIPIGRAYKDNIR